MLRIPIFCQAYLHQNAQLLDFQAHHVSGRGHQTHAVGHQQGLVHVLLGQVNAVKMGEEPDGLHQGVQRGCLVQLPTEERKGRP